MTLSHAQEQMWFLHRMEPSPAYTVPVAYDITGPLDVDVLCAALQTVVDRHEILRTEFVDVDGRPTARVHPPTPLPCPLVELTSGESELREALKAACARPLTLDGPHRMSARVYRLAAEHHVLFLMFHHIAVDGMSVQCVLDEVQRYCGSGGTGAPLPPAPQFADHVKAERAADSDPASDDAHLSYWRTRLAGVDEVTLPADRPRPTGAATHRGRLLRHDLRPGFMAAVEGLAVRERVTPFMVLLAAFAWTLGRTTGSTDIPVGVATSSRASAESFETVGLFVNMLTIRNRIDPALTFRAFLQQTRHDLLADLEHREVPFSQVVRAIRPPRRRGANPLFNVAMGYERRRPDQSLSPGVGLRPRDVRDVATGRVKFDLDVQISAAGEDSVLYVEYSSDLFDQWRIEQLLRHFEHVTATAVADPTLPLYEIQLAGQEVRDDLVERLTGPRRPTPAALLHELFEQQVRVAPARVAAECPDGTVSYAELNTRADAVAEKLRHAGVRPGERVAVRCRRGVGLPAAVLGVLKAGGAYLPVDPQAPPLRVERQFSDSGVRLVVDDGGVHTLEAGRERRPPALGRRPAYVLYTSGSTGSPKGVVVPHSAAVDFVTQFGDRFAIGAADRVLQFSNLTFDVAVLEIFTALCRGGTVCMPPLDTVRAPDELLTYLGEARVDVAALPPTVVDLMPTRPGLPLRVLSIGGEAVPASLAARWRAPGREVLNSYGPTETTVIVASHQCAPEETDPLPFGRPRANTYAYVVDGFGGLAPLGVPGELWIGGAGVADGYENAPDATREAFVPDPFVPGRGTVYRTGDRCALGPDGELTFHGRLDGQVKVRGFRVELGEVEETLSAHDDVRQAAARVIGSDAQARLAAWVVPAADRFDSGELRRWLGRRLPPYMVPSTVETIEALPLTPHGKIDRAALPDPRPAPRGLPAEQARTPQEEAVATAFAATLGVQPVGVHDDFFDLGGTSLQIMRVLAEIERRLGVSLPVGDLYAAPSVAALAERVACAPQEVLPAQLSALSGSVRPGGDGIPLFLIHPSAGSALCYAPLAQLVGEELRCWGVGAEALHGGPLPASVAAMADQYADLIAGAAPDRPVYVGGWSFGGILAHAVASRLRRRGPRAVAGLVLIDAVLPEGMPPSGPELAGSFRAEVGLTLGGSAPAVAGSDVLPELRDRFPVYAAVVDAVYRHRPGPLDVPTLLVSAARTGPSGKPWGEFLTGPVREEVVETDHFGLLRRPSVAQLARAVTDFLAQDR